MSKQTEFIEKFISFEKLLKDSTDSNDSIRFSDALKKASEKNSYIDIKYNLIEDLYALRNVFLHRERGRYVAKINDFVLKELDTLILSLKNPPTVIEKFKVEVYQTTILDSILSMMNVMREETYTHVPIWNKDKFIGVFSYTSFFEWLAEEQNKKNSKITYEKQFINDINKKYLNSPSVNYRFIKESTNLYEIPPIFESETLKQKRLDCLLITKNGIRGEKITGIITSWDLGSIK